MQSARIGEDIDLKATQEGPSKQSKGGMTLGRGKQSKAKERGKIWSTANVGNWNEIYASRTIPKAATSTVDRYRNGD